MIYNCRYSIHGMYPCNMLYETMGWESMYIWNQFSDESDFMNRLYSNPYEVQSPYAELKEAGFQKFIDVPVELVEGDQFNCSYQWLYVEFDLIRNQTILKIDGDLFTMIDQAGIIQHHVSPWKYVIYELQRKVRLHSLNDLLMMCK